MKFCNDKPWLDGMKEELDSKLREARMNELTTAEKLDALIDLLCQKVDRLGATNICTVTDSSGVSKQYKFDDKCWKKVGDSISLPMGNFNKQELKELIEQRALANRKPEPRVWFEIRRREDSANIETFESLNEARGAVLKWAFPDRYDIWYYTQYPGEPPVVEIVEDTDHE